MVSHGGGAGAYVGANISWAGHTDYGQGVAKDGEAVRWYRMAAEQGNATAQTFLGNAYDKGEGVAKDQREAVRWYRMAAEQGYAWAQTKLGYAYKKGEGVTKDPREAVRWYRMAAEQGDAGAQNNLGWAYNKGEGVAKDPREAVRWYRKAAEQGDANLIWALHTQRHRRLDELEAVRIAKRRRRRNIIWALHTDQRHRCYHGRARGGALVSQGGGAGACEGAK